MGPVVFLVDDITKYKMFYGTTLGLGIDNDPMVIHLIFYLLINTSLSYRHL